MPHLCTFCKKAFGKSKAKEQHETTQHAVEIRQRSISRQNAYDRARMPEALRRDMERRERARNGSIEISLEPGDYFNMDRRAYFPSSRGDDPT